jgi:hypothetical protein
MNDWFNNPGPAYSNFKQSRFAKHWAAMEMAATIYDDTMLLNARWGITNFPYLYELLNSEWFR